MVFRLLIMCVIFLIPATALSQQEGCTDSTALNYNEEAVINDGSCLYSPLSLKPQVLIKKLPKKVFETSGLIWWRNSYWTHNDSGGEHEIYRLDSLTGKILQTVYISNAENVDWEDIDQDDDFIYIGDFGNNLGNRTDLVIYRLPKSEIGDNNHDTLMGVRIEFQYGDQDDYTIKNRSNNYDCEALLSYGDSLYMFTKNWADQKSRIYAVPKNPGRYTVFPLNEFTVDGLITGAGMNFHKNQLVLCGYKNYVPFIWILSDFRNNDFFGGNKRRIDFKELLATQTEGIAFTGDTTFSLSAERTKLNKAKIFRLDLQEIR